MKQYIKIGILLSILLFAVHLAIIDDYGATWDFHHHFFAGLYHLGLPQTPKLTEFLPFVMPDPRGTYELPFGPLMSIAPIVTYQIFHETMGIMAWDNAYHLSIILSAVIGVFVLYLFLLEAFDFPTALTGFFFLALLPRFFGDLHNNMKDVPQAAAFALAIYTFWRLLNTRKTKDLIFAVLAFAIAFNTKVNTLFVLPITGLWTLFVLITKTRSVKALTPVFPYFFFAPVAAFVLWMPFWKDPVERLQYMFRFFLDNTQNLEVLYFGHIYKSAINVSWHYPFGYLLVTTPLPILIFFIIGLFTKNSHTKLLLILWFFIPLLRYLDPKIGVIDGIRHFEEVVFPLAAIAAIGAVATIRRFFPKKIIVILTIIFISLLPPIISYHPYQISYFNALVGGIQGAFKNFDVEYWGTSQKAAILWLNKNAQPNSFVHIVMAGDVDAKYLRRDLLERVNQKAYDNADYVVVLDRQSFFYRYYGLPEYLSHHTPVYTVSIQEVPLTLVYDNALGRTDVTPWWKVF